MKFLKRKLREFINASVVIPNVIDNRWSPETKIGLKNHYNYYIELGKKKENVSIKDAGIRVFSQFEEDGLILAIFGLIGTSNKTFVDLGSSNGINSNCANLAINFEWNGIFIDGNQEEINKGREFYKNHPDTWISPPQFKHAFIQRENINDLLKEEGISGEIDLLSIDLDGNDYWIWDAIEVISPRVVILETHIEFGMNSIVVPYDKDYFYPGKHKDYHGASPVAMNKLANKLGYRLVGANSYGFNTIYVKNGVGEDVLPKITVKSNMWHPRNKEREKLFEPIKDWEYINV